MNLAFRNYFTDVISLDLLPLSSVFATKLVVKNPDLLGEQSLKIFNEA